MKLIAQIFTVLFLVTLFTHVYLKRSNTQSLLKRSSRFTPIEELGTYTRAMPERFAGKEKKKRAILFLHGYAAAPSQFEEILVHLREADLPYYAPRLLGHGLNSFHLFEAVKGSDWIRETVEAYDMLASEAQVVDVVGYSNGGALAAVLAKHRPIGRMVLIAPNVVSTKNHKLARKILGAPIIRQITEWAAPILSGSSIEKLTRSRTCDRSLDREACSQQFYYPAYVTRSAEAIWAVQDAIELSKMQVDKVDLFFASRDQFVSQHETRAAFDKAGVPYTPIEIENDHYLLLSKNRKSIVEQIVSHLIH